MFGLPQVHLGRMLGLFKDLREIRVIPVILVQQAETGATGAKGDKGDKGDPATVNGKTTDSNGAITLYGSDISYQFIGCDHYSFCIKQ